MKKSNFNNYCLWRSNEGFRCLILFVGFLLMGAPSVFANSLTIGKLVLEQTQFQVSGTIYDDTGSPLGGASVVEKGTVNGTQTDFDGNFNLTVSDGNSVLVVSYIGFETKEVPINGQSRVTVDLQVSTSQLDEVVIIGYGSTTIKDATGSVTAVKAKDFNKGNIVTPENLVSGRVAGLSVISGGEPGAGAQIRIRGGSSLDASNDPLIVINGLPIENNRIGGSRSILSTINPNDIESFTVLKDASATAIYGSRAANGVIIITTKKGTKNLAIDLDARIGANTLVSTLDVFSSDEFRNVISEQRPELLPLLGIADTDWQEEVYRTAIVSDVNFSARGSLFNEIPVRLSLGRSVQEGLRLTSEFERNNAGLTINPDLFDGHLSVLVNANASLEKNRFAQGVEGRAITFDPTQPVYDDNSPFGGFFQYFEDNGDGQLNASDLTPNAPFNPVADLLQTNDVSEVWRFYGNLKLDYKLHFFPDLRAVINIGYDEQSADGSRSISSENPVSQPDGSFLGSETMYTNYQRNRLFDGYLAYNKELGETNLVITGGYSFQKFESNQFLSGELLNDNPDTEPIFNVDTDLVLIGFFGRTNLSFADKYLLTLSYRRDGSSRFSEENRWGNFPAAAFAWKLNEDLFPKSKVFSSMKLRLGWGITGQQDIGRANSDLFLNRVTTGINTSQIQFGDDIIPVAIPNFRNENLKWEETTTYNAGIDFGLFNDRFNGTVEAFYKESDDLLAFAAISDGSNFSNAGFQNIGNFTSQGLEFTLNGDLIESQDSKGFNWNFNYNLTYLEREIESLALNQDQLRGNVGGGASAFPIQINRIGLPPNSFFVFKQIFDANGNPIEGAFADLNGDNVVNDDDRYIAQKPDPDVTMGFLSNLSYRNFDLSFNLRASLNNYVFNGVNARGAHFNQLQNVAVAANIPSSVLDTGFNVTENVNRSDIYLENASFLRMDNITLGYSFNEITKSDRSQVRLYAGVQNVFTITDYSGLDPEIANGIDTSIFPRARTFYLGTNVKF